jgi:glutathione synthase
MDPVEHIDIRGDSTFVMGLEAQARGYELLHYQPDDMFYDQGRVMAEVRPLTLRREHGNHHDFGPARIIDLAAETDVILMRQDPPFDMNYITATHLLEAIHPETFVVNHPGHVRNAPEKLFVTRFPDLMPPTLITRSLARIRDFRDQHKDIIVKPLFGNGGAGVFHIKPDDENLASLIELFSIQSREPLMVQSYLPAVRKGDKRIILVDGEPVGAINRVPAEGEARSNMHVGGVAEKSMLTEREREICERIGPELKKRDLIFVGIDVIGDYLTEINVTSPTGLQEINRFDGSKLEGLIWDAIETRLS